MSFSWIRSSNKFIKYRYGQKTAFTGRAKTRAIYKKRKGYFDNPTLRTYNVHMIKFDWNAAKAVTNIKKHGVSFEEAKSVFFDDFAVQFFDQENSEAEDRFLMLGMSNETRLLIVCHCERDDGNTIRVISARKATKNESKHYLRGD
ncbi:BrnT family toxin [Shewanella sp. A14]